MKPQVEGESMNRIIMMMLAFVFCAFLGGCAATGELAKTASVSSRQDVFAEQAPGQPPPPGYAELRIVSSLKTHKPGKCFGRDGHGTQEYKLLLNIGGQETEIAGDLSEENRESGSSKDPEEGEGIRYQFMRNLYVKAGAYRVVATLPADNIATERQIVLAGGSINTLRLEPVYHLRLTHRRLGEGRLPTFRQGIKQFRVVLNGTPL